MELSEELFVKKPLFSKKPLFGKEPLTVKKPVPVKKPSGRLTLPTKETQESALFMYLLAAEGASFSYFELEIEGFINPSAIVYRLKKKNIPIKCKHEASHVINGNVVHSHYRYYLQIEDLFGGLYA